MLVGPARSQSHMIARVCEGIPVAIFDSHLWKTAVTVAGAKLYSMSTLVSYSNIEAYRGSPYGALPLPLVAPEPIDRRAWFAVYTKSHHEKSIARHLSQKGIEHYLPLYKAKRTWTHGRHVTLDLPLFPNYVFVHISDLDRVRVLATEGVLMFVDRGNVVTPIPNVEIERLRAELHLRRSEPHPRIAIVQKGRILAGPLAGMEGIVLRRKGDLRVVLTAPLINMCVAVEVNADEVVPAEPILSC